MLFVFEICGFTCTIINNSRRDNPNTYQEELPFFFLVHVYAIIQLITVKCKAKEGGSVFLRFTTILIECHSGRYLLPSSTHTPNHSIVNF